MYNPIETPEQIEAACRHAEQRIAEVRAMMASINHPSMPQEAADAVIGACKLTAARLLDVPATGGRSVAVRG